VLRALPLAAACLRARRGRIVSLQDAPGVGALLERTRAAVLRYPDVERPPSPVEMWVRLALRAAGWHPPDAGYDEPTFWAALDKLIAFRATPEDGAVAVAQEERVVRAFVDWRRALGM